MRVTVDQFRKEAMDRKRGVRRGASEYPAELRKFAVAFAREAIVGGGSMFAAARDLGVSAVTLAKWVSDADVATAPVFREVVVEPEAAAPRALVLVTAGGMRVEGLDVETAAALLAKLR
jgi:transposase-like protein